MNTYAFSSNTLRALAVALLAGCSGAQAPISAPTAIQQTRAVTTQGKRGGSWMLPEAKTRELLYASDLVNREVWVFSYPDGKLVGDLSGFPAQPAGLCSDSSGDVYVTVRGPGVSSSPIYEYAHGGATPINTLSDPGQAFGCAIDPTTGNLAVGNPYAASVPNVAVFQGAKGMPTIFTDPKGAALGFCAYDNQGNLYANGDLLDELPAGGDSLSEIQLPKSMYNTGSIQWAADHLIMAAVFGSGRGPEPLYKVAIVGGIGKVEGTITLSNSEDKRAIGGVQYWIQGSRIIGPGLADSGNILLQLWKFPRGGIPVQIIRPHHGHRAFLGDTVSVAPSR